MTHADIIEAWPSVADFSRDIGVKYQTARFMKVRNSIHPRYWRRVVQAAKDRGIRGVSMEKLTRASTLFQESAA